MWTRKSIWRIIYCYSFTGRVHSGSCIATTWHWICEHWSKAIARVIQVRTLIEVIKHHLGWRASYYVSNCGRQIVEEYNWWLCSLAGVQGKYASSKIVVGMHILIIWQSFSWSCLWKSNLKVFWWNLIENISSGAWALNTSESAEGGQVSVHY